MLYFCTENERNLFSIENRPVGFYTECLLITRPLRKLNPSTIPLSFRITLVLTILMALSNHTAFLCGSTLLHPNLPLSSKPMLISSGFSYPSSSHRLTQLHTSSALCLSSTPPLPFVSSLALPFSSGISQPLLFGNFLGFKVTTVSLFFSQITLWPSLCRTGHCPVCSF